MKKVLLVEDENPILAALNKKLSAAGYEIVTAKNGQEGLQEALEKKPDLVLLDMIMPRADGMTMLEELRRDEWGKTVPVIILSNLEDKEMVAQAFELEVRHYVVKTNTKIEDVVKLVENELNT